MSYSIFLSILLLLAAEARENPFFPLDETKKQKVTSNTADTYPHMGTIHYTFADNARVIKEVTFTIQNLDGSIEEKKYPVDRRIDWHHPISLSQSKSSLSKDSTAPTNSSSAANFGFIQLYSKSKEMTLKSSDPLVRHFVLTNPNRIVLDFKHETAFKSEKKVLNAPPFLDVTVGNHGKFARATITLDGRYSYALKNNGSLISLSLK